MKNRITIYLKYFLILLIFLSGQPAASIFAQEKKQEVKKKRPTGKKTTRRRKPATSNKKRPTASSKKRSPSSGSKQQQRKRRPAPKQSSISEKNARQVNPAPKENNLPDFNPYEYSEEFFNITEELNSSSRQLAKATTYLEPSNRQKTVRINSAALSQEKLQALETKAVENPNDYRTMRTLGLEYERMHNYPEAKDIYFRLISRDPLNPDFHYYLGSLYKKTGELNKAQSSFEEALALDPQHKATLDVLSSMGHSPVKSLKRSNEVLTTTANSDPNGPASKVASLKNLIAIGDFDSAILEADDAIREYPEYSGIKILKGHAYEQLGQTEKAKALYQEVIKTDPMNVEGHRALGDLYYGDNKFLYAGLAYSDVVYLDGSSIDERYLQGLSFFKANEWGRAANAWEDLLRIKPDHNLTLIYLPQVYYILAVEYNRTGESSLGRNSFNKAFQVNGNTRMWLPGALKSLGKFYREKNMFRESLAAYQEAAELSPNDADAYLGLGITYWQMKEPQLARGAWERSLEISPDNNESRGWMIITKQGS